MSSRKKDTGVTIQINSLEALERLIGGDSKLEMTIRKSIAYDFAGKYLKGIIDASAIKEFKADIMDEIHKEFYVSERAYGNKLKWSLKPELKEMLAKEAKTAAQEEFKKMWDEVRTKVLEDILTDRGVSSILEDLKASISASAESIVTSIEPNILRATVEREVINRLNAMQKMLASTPSARKIIKD